MATPFQTALNVAGRPSTPMAILPKPQAPKAQQMIQPPIKKKSNPAPNAQVAAYGKAMNQANKNTKTYR